jgi:hypothetical protein
MDARIYTIIRRDAVSLYRLNIFASMFIVAAEAILLLLLLIAVKLNAGVEVLIVLGCMLAAFPFLSVKYYRKRFRYYSVVRLKDIIYELLKPSSTHCNNYYRKLPTIPTIRISATRKRG